MYPFNVCEIGYSHYYSVFSYFSSSSVLHVPALHIPGIIHGKIVFIVDNSASMLSREMGNTRLDIAKQEALKLIMKVSASGGIMIMSTHPLGSHIQQTFTVDEDKLKSAVKSIAASHTASDFILCFCTCITTY